MGYHCFSETRPTAQKPHRCVWCFFEVREGSQYVRERSIYDGTHQNHAWHAACHADATDYFNATGESEFTSSNEMPFYALYELDARLALEKTDDR